MDSAIDTLNQAAATWWLYVVAATWQGSLVAVVGLTVVWSWRRLSSPVRYALLLLVLVKFSLPPTWAAPTGLFSRLSPKVPAWTASDRHSTDAGYRVPSAAVTPPVAPRRHESPQPRKGSRVLDNASVSETAGVALPASVETTPATGADIRSVEGVGIGRIGGRSWLMLLHAAGCLAGAVWVVLNGVRLARIWQRSQRVTSGPLFDCFLQASRQMGIRRPAVLRVSSEAIAPMAFGLLQPRVLLPVDVIRGLDRRQVAAVLAHELAHHRRWDPWVNWAQITIALLWWFNPAVWLLNRAICHFREDCCDDLILHGGFVDRTAYSESLIRTAEVLSKPLTAGRSLGLAHPMHPLGKRLERVMDATLKRSARLSMGGAVLTVLLAAILLPGISVDADESPSAGPADIATAPPRADSADGPSTEPAAADTLALAGTVTDEAGNPVAGVRVRSYVDSYKSIFDEAHTTTDEDGHFQLAGLRTFAPWSRLAWANGSYGSRRLVFEHPDFAVTAYDASLYRHVGRDFDPMRIERQLLRPTSFSGVVTDEDGKPVEGATVVAEVQVRRDRQRSGPSEVAETFYSSVWYEQPPTTDAEGRFVIENLPQLSMLHLRIEHPDYATHDTRNEMRVERNGRLEPLRGRYYPLYAGDHDLQVRLSPGATIKGRLLNDGKPHRRAAVRIEAVPAGGSLRREPWTLTDADGRYKLTGLAEGTHDLWAAHQLLTDVGLVPKPVRAFEAKAETRYTGIDIEVTPGRILTGRLIHKITGRSITKDDSPDGRVTVVAHLAGDSPIFLNSREVDDKGHYRIRVLPGECQVSAPEWRDGRPETVTRTVDVPETGPIRPVDFAVTTRPMYHGLLVDERGRPVAGKLLVPGERTPIETDEGGRFSIPAPWSAFYEHESWEGSYALSSDKTLGAWFWWKWGDIKRKEELLLKPVVLRPLARLQGRVVDAGGKPVGDAIVKIRLKVENGMLFSSAKVPWQPEVRPDGTFIIRRIAVSVDAPMQLELGIPCEEDSHGSTWKRLAEVPLDGLEPGQTLYLGDVVLEEE